jgi:hypothetical protein
MSVMFKAFDDWRGANLACATTDCGWRGRIDVTQLEEQRGYSFFECPLCGTTVALVQHPTADEVSQNWDSLTDAEKALYQRRFALDSEFEAHHLERPEQLPEIADDPLILVWDFDCVEINGHEVAYTLLKYEGRVIWLERAFYECLGRYEEVVKLLQQKFGGRLKDVVPTRRSETYLLGDMLSGWEKLNETRSCLSPVAPDEALRVHALAKAGDQEALNLLRHQEEIARHCLRTPEQLPDIEGAFVVLGFSVREDPPRVKVLVTKGGSRSGLHCEWGPTADGFLYLCLVHDGREIWRESAPPDVPRRYGEMAVILKEKYGTRLKGVVPTYALEAYCHGLSLEELHKQAQALFPESRSTAPAPAVRAAVLQALAYGSIVNQGREKD